jgi:hypothetical protein
MDIVEVISNVGFPIACVIALAYYVREINNQHKTEVDDLRTAIENNTLVITKLIDRLDLDMKGGEKE